MTSLADRTIVALRAAHTDVASWVPGLTDDQLALTSGAPEWTVDGVLSHLGSMCEISIAALRATLSDGSPPDDSLNQAVWSRWDALSPRARATEFLRYDDQLVTELEAVPSTDIEARVGFLPYPLPFAAVVGMRLSELALHSWDARVAMDPAATVMGAELLAEHHAGDMSFLLGFVGKADQLSEPAVVDIAGSGYGISIGDGVRLVSTPQAPTAVLTAPLEAVVRLLAGRLAPEHTPASVTCTGNVTLDDLRRVFPGY